jgi:hypothetical protein
VVLNDVHELAVPDWSQRVGHQKPSPFFRARTPSIHRFSSLVFGYKNERTCAKRQNRYQDNEYTLLGMAIKIAGLRGKEVRVIGKNRSTHGEEEKIQ